MNILRKLKGERETKAVSDDREQYRGKLPNQTY